MLKLLAILSIFATINSNMDYIYKVHQDLISSLKTSFRRTYIDEIEWRERLIAIKGCRGVGKTTLILQHIKEVFGTDPKACYISMDNLMLRGSSITEIAAHHFKTGGTHLFIDEIHKQDDWSLHIKNIYDMYPGLSIVISGSSLLKIYNAQTDLSRRAVTYDIPGLSFREFINIELKASYEPIALSKLLNDHINIVSTISQDIKILPLFKSYLTHGYYPFYLESKKSYSLKLDQIINTILEVDLPTVLKTDIHQINKIKKLIHYLAIEVPFQPNISKLAASIEVHRNHLYEYIYYLDQAKIFHLLQEEGKSYSMMSKPEKIYLHNTNIHMSLAPSITNPGTLREVFFFNQVSAKHQVHASKSGDFLVDGTYVFEVGGTNKTFKQIANHPNSYLVIDDDATGVKNKIPLWIFGFLY
jgi:predicted AAA+ superfamily ATPase